MSEEETSSSAPEDLDPPKVFCYVSLMIPQWRREPTRAQPYISMTGNFYVRFQKDISHPFWLHIGNRDLGSVWRGCVAVKALLRSEWTLVCEPVHIALSPRHREVAIHCKNQRDWSAYVMDDDCVRIIVTITDLTLYTVPIERPRLELPGFCPSSVPPLNACLQLFFNVPLIRTMAINRAEQNTTMGLMGEFFAQALESKLPATFNNQEIEVSGDTPVQLVTNMVKEILEEEPESEVAPLFSLRISQSGAGDTDHYIMTDELQQLLECEENMLLRAPSVLFLKTGESKGATLGDTYIVDGTAYSLVGLISKDDDTRYTAFVRYENLGLWMKYADESVTFVSAEEALDEHRGSIELAMLFRWEHIAQLKTPQQTREIRARDPKSMDSPMTVHVVLPEDLQKELVFGRLQYRDAKRSFVVSRNITHAALYWKIRCFVRVFDQDFRVWVINEDEHFVLMPQDEEMCDVSEIRCLIQYIYPDQDDVPFFVSVIMFQSHSIQLNYVFTLAVDPSQPIEVVARKFRQYTRTGPLAVFVRGRAAGTEDFVQLEDVALSLDTLGVRCGDFVIVAPLFVPNMCMVPEGVRSLEMNRCYLSCLSHVNINAQELNDILSMATDTITINRSLGNETCDLVVPKRARVADFATFAAIGSNRSDDSLIETPLLFRGDSVKPISYSDTDLVRDVFTDGSHIDVYYYSSVSKEFFDGCVRLIIQIRLAQVSEFVQLFPGRLTVGELIVRAARRGWISAQEEIEETRKLYRVIQLGRNRNELPSIIPHSVHLADLPHNRIMIQPIPSDQRDVDPENVKVELLVKRRDDEMQAEFFVFRRDEMLCDLQDRIAAYYALDIDKWTLVLERGHERYEPEECDKVFDMLSEGFIATLYYDPVD